MARFPSLLLLLLLAGFAGPAPAAAAAPAAAEVAAEADPYDPLAGAPAPLAAALRQYAHDATRWAYTLRRVEYDKRGKREEERVSRFDPSVHYDEQWTLLAVDGQPATPAQVKRNRAEIARHMKKHRTLGELLDLPRATLAREDATTLTYEVPLVSDDNARLPPEKFQVFVHVRKAGRVFAAIDVKLRESWRVAGVVKVKSGEAHLVFSTVQPEFAPPLTAVEAGGRASVLFITFGGRIAEERTDFQRVKPYDERFSVKIGPVKALDF